MAKYDVGYEVYFLDNVSGLQPRYVNVGQIISIDTSFVIPKYTIATYDGFNYVRFEYQTSNVEDDIKKQLLGFTIFGFFVGDKVYFVDYDDVDYWEPMRVREGVVRKVFMNEDGIYYAIVENENRNRDIYLEHALTKDLDCAIDWAGLGENKRR